MVNKKKFILKSFSWVALSNFITKPLWLLLFVYAARVLGVEQFGIYTYALSIVMIVSIFFDFGLDYIAIREISKSNNQLNKYFSQVISVRIFFFLIICSFFLLYFYIVNSFETKQTIAIIIVLLFQFTTIILTYQKSISSAFHEFNIFSFMMIFEKLLLTIFGFFALYIMPGIISFLSSLLLANIISLIVFLILLRIKYKLQFHLPQLKELVALLKEALPLLTMNIFILTYFRIDVIIMDWITGDKSIIGIYGSIHRIVEMYMLIPTILMTTAYPIINKYIDENREFVDKFLHQILQALIAISLPIVIVIALNSYTINYLVFGNEYKRGSEGLLYIIWTIIPLGLTYVLGNLLISLKKQNYCALGVGIGATINVALNLLLIPKFNFVGSSITTVVTETVILVIYGYFVVKYFPKIGLVELGFKSISISVLNLSLFYIYNKFFNYNFVVSIILFVPLTVILIFVTKILNFRDLVNYFKSVD